MDKKIQEIREALAAATPGPWEVVDIGQINIAKDYRKNGDKHIAQWIAEMDIQNESEEEQAYSDAQLIANAPEYISYLLQQIEIKDEALEFYANRYKGRVLVAEMDYDNGKRARTALKGEDTNATDNHKAD